MTYDQYAINGDREGNAELLTPALWKWDEVDKILVGRYLGRHEVPSGLGAGVFYLYLFDTDDGRVQFALGAGIDSSVGDQFLEGHIYKIVYRGKSKTSRGFNVNNFEVTGYGKGPKELGNGKAHTPAESPIQSESDGADDSEIF